MRRIRTLALPSALLGAGLLVWAANWVDTTDAQFTANDGPDSTNVTVTGNAVELTTNDTTLDDNAANLKWYRGAVSHSSTTWSMHLQKDDGDNFSVGDTCLLIDDAAIDPLTQDQTDDGNTDQDTKTITGTAALGSATYYVGLHFVDGGGGNPDIEAVMADAGDDTAPAYDGTPYSLFGNDTAVPNVENLRFLTGGAHNDTATSNGNGDDWGEYVITFDYTNISPVSVTVNIQDDIDTFAARTWTPPGYDVRHLGHLATDVDNGGLGDGVPDAWDCANPANAFAYDDEWGNIDEVLVPNPNPNEPLDDITIAWHSQAEQAAGEYYLNGPLAVTVDVENEAELSALFTYTGAYESEEGNATEVLLDAVDFATTAYGASTGSTTAYWSDISMTVTAGDGDVQIWVSCSDDPASFPDPSADLVNWPGQPFSGAGPHTIDFMGTGYCEARYLQYRLELIGGVTSGPTVEDVTVGYSLDADGDGYESDGIFTDADCDDDPSGNGANIYPNNATPTIADTIDDDCDGADECYADGTDNDGYAAAGASIIADNDDDSCADNGEAAALGDCKDDDAGFNPGVADTPGDNFDQNCDDTIACYVDGENDGYGAGAGVEVVAFTATDGDADTSGICAASGSDGYDDTNDDCDDTDSNFNPGQTDDPGDGFDENCSGEVVCYVDSDNDEYGSSTSAEAVGVHTAVNGVGNTGGCAANNTDGYDDTGDDCNDSAVGTNPGVVTDTPGNDIDENCSGEVACYTDTDNDGYGVGSGVEATGVHTASNGVSAVGACGSLNNDGFADVAGDCLDSVASTNPGATDVAGDDADDNCNGTIVCYIDSDNDEYGSSASEEVVAYTAANGVSNTGSNKCASSDTDGYDDQGNDCDDTDDTVFPSGPDVPGNDLDENCDGTVACYTDADLDGYGTGSGVESTYTATNGLADGPPGACNTNLADGYANVATDCNDGAFGTNPGIATDTPGNDADENCSGEVACYVDSDLDGYGAGAGVEATGVHTAANGVVNTAGCDANLGDGFDDTNDDCNDSAIGTNPGATDDPGDDVDENCSGEVVCYVDSDKDGYGAGAGVEATGVHTAVNGVVNTAGCDANLADGFDDTGDDCNDSAIGTNPGATDDPGDDVDENCSGAVVCYVDGDNDGYGDGGGVEAVGVHTASNGTVNTGGCDANTTDNFDDDATDCDDGDSVVNPGAAELCDGVDTDCVGGLPPDESDDDPSGGDDFVECDPSVTGDGDGIWRGDPAILGGNDCNDGDNAIYPTALDDCNDQGTSNAIDNDCDGTGGPGDDEDGDGLDNTTEIGLLLDDCVADLDGDNLSDGEEITAGTLPKNPDSDGDNVQDDIEVGGDVNNPLNTDGDGLINALDNDDDGDGVRTDIEDQRWGNNDGDPTNDFCQGGAVPDYLNNDDDNDTILTADEDVAEGPDSDSDPNPCDTDSDGDGHLDSEEAGDANPATPPINYDGADTPDYLDTDSDNDTVLDIFETPGLNTDGTGNPDRIDEDDDDDQVLTKDENYNGGDPRDDNTDNPIDSIPDYLDDDDDGDTLLTKDEQPISNDGNPKNDDWDFDTVPNYLDDDDDDDNLLTSFEVVLESEHPNIDGDGIPAWLDTDSDNDSVADINELVIDTDGDTIENSMDNDDDGDGILTSDEELLPNADSDGIDNYLDTDSDGDGWPDDVEGFVNSDGTDTPDFVDTDSDNDTVLDVDEYNDGTKDGVDDDSDGDGKDDRIDDDDDDDNIYTATENASPPGDSDGIPNHLDDDSDGDGWSDAHEAGDSNITTDPVNTDFPADNIADYLDQDSDDDNVDDVDEYFSGARDGINDSTDSDGLEDRIDPDDDNDNVPTKDEDPNGNFNPLDDNTDASTGDLLPNYRDPDDDGDGILTIEEDSIYGNNDGDPQNDHTDSDGVADYLDDDDDDDTILTIDEYPSGAPRNPDFDAFENHQDTDSDGDGRYFDEEEAGDSDPNTIPVNTDGTDLPDFLDSDSDNDTVVDALEFDEDRDGTGGHNRVDADDDGDGIPTATEEAASCSGCAPDRDGDTIDNYRDFDSDDDTYLDSEEGNVDSDGDTFPDYLDTDSDDDTVADIDEVPGSFDSDGLDDRIDDDDDNDGIPTAVEYNETCTQVNPCSDNRDGDGEPNHRDLDSDNDNYPDAIEAGSNPANPANNDGDLVPDYLDADSDDDGIADIDEFHDTDNLGNTDGDGLEDRIDPDDDGDGIPTSVEGNGNFDGTDLPDYRDTDSDNDGHLDADERGPDGNNPTNTDSNGNPDYIDLDSDDDEVPDLFETPGLNTDNDGMVDRVDTDDDNDNIPTALEDWDSPGDPMSTNSDAFFDTSDNIADYLDNDDDNDGILTIDEDWENNGVGDGNPLNDDRDGQDGPDYRDEDDDNDNILTIIELNETCLNCTPDADGDGDWNHRDTDSDEDGFLDIDEGNVASLGDDPVNTDNDSYPDYLDDDSDNDTIADIDELHPQDTNTDASTGDILPNRLDTDDDGDNILTADEAAQPNADTDGTPNYLDTDSDGDGWPDVVEAGDTDLQTPAVNSDGTDQQDYLDTDSDNDSVLDIDEYNDGTKDGINDNWDATLAAPVTGDGLDDRIDPDDDNDGIPTLTEHNETCSGCSPDFDGDNTPNYLDVDSDDDTILDQEEGNGNTDSPADQNPDYLDTDSDNDGFLDSVEAGDAVLATAAVESTLDGDSIKDYLDDDSDGDSVLDVDELHGANGTDFDSDGDNLPDRIDTDDDGDTILTITEHNETCTDPAQGNAACSPDRDGDNTLNYLDLDSDEDGWPDSVEAGDTNPGTDPIDTDNAGAPDYLAWDSDADSVVDADEDGVGGGDDDFDDDNIPDRIDDDDDNDGILTVVEQNETCSQGGTPCSSDRDGDNIENYHDLDSDADNILDSEERQGGASPANSDGDSVPDYLDTDSDNDGFLDIEEAGDTNLATAAAESALDSDSIPDYLDDDSDGDSVLDIDEQHPHDFDEDGDNLPDRIDTDDDGDTILTREENTESCSGCSPDRDGDTVPNYLDLDSDADGWPDAVEAGDTDPNTVARNFDGVDQPDYLDLDSDDDTVVDADEYNDGTKDGINDNTDGDGEDDRVDVDDDNDGILTAVEHTETCTDCSPNRDENLTGGDNIPNHRDLDSDADGFTDAEEAEGDVDGDNIPNYLDLDSDNDGRADIDEVNDANPANEDSDGDGIDDRLDNDDDNDGIRTDYEDAMADGDSDGIPNYLDLDSDDDGWPDAVERGNATLADPPVDSETTIDGTAVPDGTPDYLDLDSDDDNVPDADEYNDGTKDGVNDNWDALALGGVNHVSDSLDDRIDPDDDGDEIPTKQEDPNANNNPQDDDYDGDLVPDFLDPDDDDDSVATRDEDINGVNTALDDDTDGDSSPNYLDIDDDQDTINTIDEDPNGNNDPLDDNTDGDAAPDYLDNDDDNDTILTRTEQIDGPHGPDSDGIPNYRDLDSDDDGWSDEHEWNFGPGLGDSTDFDGDGMNDYVDLDSDNDTVPDASEEHNGATMPFLTFDRDGDTYENRIDDDDDNDSIPTADEEWAAWPPGGCTGTITWDGTDWLCDGSAVTLGNGDPRDDDYDGDTLEDYLDSDDDNDNVLTVFEDYAHTGNGVVAKGQFDANADGIKDDGDGDPRNENTDRFEEYSDQLPDFLDIDDDGDQIPTALEESDTIDIDPTNDNLDRNEDNNDDLPNYIDWDDDGDTYATKDEDLQPEDGTDPIDPRGVDFDNDGIFDAYDFDDDNDGVPSRWEAQFSGPGDTWHLNIDSDNDAILDGQEWINWLTYDGSTMPVPTYCGTYSGNSSSPADKPVFNETYDYPGAWSCALDPVAMQNYGWGTPPGDSETIRDGFYDVTNPSTPVWVEASVQTGSYWSDPWDRDADGIANFLDNDDDGDGVSTFEETDADIAEICPGFGGNITTPGDGVPNYLDRDADGDQLIDWQETQGGLQPSIDSDQDGIFDFLDCSATGPDGDTDKDGLTNAQEAALGSDPFLPDTDGDGVVDSKEVEWRVTNPQNPPEPFNQDSDSDGTNDWADVDDDGDGVWTRDEVGPVCSNGDTPSFEYYPPDTNPQATNGDWEWWCDPGNGNLFLADLQNTDADRAGALPLNPDDVLDYLDTDDDGDGIPTLVEFDSTWCSNDSAPPGPNRDVANPDAWLCVDGTDPGVPETDGDGIVDHLDMDDNDGPFADLDGDGLSNGDEEDIYGTDPYSDDTDGDGISDNEEIGDNPNKPQDTDEDGTIDALDKDDDGDGINTIDESDADPDGDGLPNYLDDDSNGDGVLDGDQTDDVDCDGVTDAYDDDTDVGPCAPAEEKLDSDGTPWPEDCSCSTASPTQGAFLVFMAGLLGLRRRERRP